MQNKETQKARSPWWGLIAGLAVAQILATVQVHLAGRNLHDRLVIIRDAGFFTVPNEHVLPSLLQWQPAFWGGLFFTFSIGLGVTLVTYGLIWIWDRVFHRHRGFLFVAILFWGGCLVVLNITGLNLLDSLYFILIPLFVLIMRWRAMPQLPRQEVWARFCVYTIPVVLLITLWAPKIDGSQFLSLRDTMLLSNPVGVRLNDFYYKYTLYPAEVFKSLDQKLLRTYALADEEAERYSAMLQNILVPRDYLPIDSDTSADLVISVSGNDFVFQAAGKSVLTMAVNDFVKQPDAFLKEYAVATDRHLPFREFVYLSIVVCLLVVPYLLMYTFFNFLINAVMKNRISSPIRVVFGAVLAVTLLVFMFPCQEKVRNVEQIAGHLAGGEWQQRVAALQYVAEEGLELGDYRTYEKILTSPYAAERYWLAKALGASRLPSTHDDLLTLLADPHPNVVSMALYGLGQRGEKRSIDTVKNHITTSDHWYEQWYGYRALKSLGWQQEGLQ